MPLVINNNAIGNTYSVDQLLGLPIGQNGDSVFMTKAKAQKHTAAYGGTPAYQGGMHTFVSMPTTLDAEETIGSLYMGFRIAAAGQPQFASVLQLNGTVTYPAATARWIE